MYKLSYIRSGSGKPLMLLHGNGEDHTIFRNQMDVLTKHYDVIAVDTRGHGRSPRGTAPFTLSQFAVDLAGLMDRLGIEKAHLVGYSDGGNIALLFALRYPKRVRTLVINGANLFPTGLKPLLLAGIRLRYALLSPMAPCSIRTRRKREMLGLMACQPHIRPVALAALRNPVLVLAGTRDVVRAAHTRLIARSLPDSRLVFLPGGHALPIETPEGYNRAVLAFLAEHDN